jgi:transcriptional regulator of acetoin/glycerol metabolism
MRRAIHGSRLERARDIEVTQRCNAVLITGNDYRMRRRMALQIHESRNHGASAAFIQVRTATEQLNLTDNRSRLIGASLFLEDVGQLTTREQAALVEWFDGQAAGALSERVPLRIIAAADACLYDWVQRGAFRADLFYRLNVVHIVIPEWRSPSAHRGRRARRSRRL